MFQLVFHAVARELGLLPIRPHQADQQRRGSRYPDAYVASSTMSRDGEGPIRCWLLILPTTASSLQLGRSLRREVAGFLGRYFLLCGGEAVQLMVSVEAKIRTLVAQNVEKDKEISALRSTVAELKQRVTKQSNIPNAVIQAGHSKSPHEDLGDAVESSGASKRA